MKVCVGWPWRVVQGVSRVRSHRKAAASSPAARAARSKLCERRRVLTVGALLSQCHSGARLPCGGRCQPRTAVGWPTPASLASPHRGRGSSMSASGR
jgi:hypothetical protein